MPSDELPDELPDDLRISWKEAGMNGQVFSPNQLRAEAEKCELRCADSTSYSALVSQLR